MRQEIADEILDHLQCSLRCELLLNHGDEDSARQRVLEKFGDPRQIARQLWFQAMWSKIMSQRFVISLASVSMILSILMGGLVGWMVYRNSQDAIAQQKQMALSHELLARMIAENRDSMGTLISESRQSLALSMQDNHEQPQRDLNWNHLKVIVTLDREDGPPAVGYSINVSQVPRIGDTTGDGKMAHGAILDATGAEDCGFVTSGKFEVTVTTPWGETTQVPFTIHPGQDHKEHCIAPSKIPELTTVALSLKDLPQATAECHTACVCWFAPSGFRTFAERRWSPGYWGWNRSTGLNTTPTVNTPCLLFVPGHGIWMTENGQSFVGSDPAAAAKRVAWKRCEFPLKFELPTHEYKTIFSLIPLNELVSPDDTRWKEKIAVHESRFGVVQPVPSPPWEVSTKFFAIPWRVNEWAFGMPPEVVEAILENKQLPNQPFSGTGMFQSGGGFF